MKRLLLLWLAFSISASGQKIDFKLHSYYLIVAKCSVESERDLTAIVDTGVTETVIDLKLVKRLSLATRPDTATFGTRDARVQAVSISNISFGPLHADELAGIAADLSYLTHQFGVRPDLLIGMDLLRQATFLIDYRKKQIVFGPIPQMAHSAALLPDARLLLVEAAVDSQKLRLQIDTGINGIFIYGGRLHIVPLTSLNSHAGAIGATANSQLLILPHLQIGDWRGNQIAAAMTDDSPAGLTEFDGLLGPTGIGVHRVGVDWGNRIITWD
jgi:predicted aspartyl protease